MVDSTGRMLLRIAPMTYGPVILFGIGEGALIPVIPVMAADLGADLATAGVIASMAIVGRMVGNLPAGWLVSRFGERITMIGASLLGLIAVLSLSLSSTLGVFTLSIFVIGICDAAFSLARHAFMTTRVPLYFRARALSLLGGSYRLGIFVGPFVAVLLMGLTGSEYSTAWFFTAMFVGIILLVYFGPDPETEYDEQTLSGEPREIDRGAGAGAAVVEAEGADPHPRAPDSRDGKPGVFRTMHLYRGVLARVGVAAAALSAVRAARQVVLPLWGVSIGLDSQVIAMIIGIAGAIDFALFYVSGQVMDRFGRIWAVLPSMVLMGLGFFVLGLTHDLDDAAGWFAAMAFVAALGNGFSSGILMTLGADLAPRQDPAPFLSSWRALTDAGGAIVPLAFSGIVALSTMGVATVLVGAISFAGAAGFVRWLPRYVPRSPKAAAAAPGADAEFSAETDSEAGTEPEAG